MQPTSGCLFLSTLLNKAFVTCVISVSFVFSSDLFIFSIWTFTSSSFFWFYYFVLKSVFDKDKIKGDYLSEFSEKCANVKPVYFAEIIITKLILWFCYKYWKDVFYHIVDHELMLTAILIILLCQH